MGTVVCSSALFATSVSFDATFGGATQPNQVSIVCLLDAMSPNARLGREHFPIVNADAEPYFVRLEVPIDDVLRDGVHGNGAVNRTLETVLSIKKHHHSVTDDASYVTSIVTRRSRHGSNKGRVQLGNRVRSMREILRSVDLRMSMYNTQVSISFAPCVSASRFGNVMAGSPECGTVLVWVMEIEKPLSSMEDTSSSSSSRRS